MRGRVQYLVYTKVFKGKISCAQEFLSKVAGPPKIGFLWDV